MRVCLWVIAPSRQHEPGERFCGLCGVGAGLTRVCLRELNQKETRVKRNAQICRGTQSKSRRRREQCANETGNEHELTDREREREVDGCIC